MSDTWQIIIVAIVVAAAVAVAARSIYRAITHKKSALNPCDSCALRETCTRANEQTFLSNNCKQKYD